MVEWCKDNTDGNNQLLSIPLSTSSFAVEFIHRLYTVLLGRAANAKIKWDGNHWPHQKNRVGHRPAPCTKSPPRAHTTQQQPWNCHSIRSKNEYPCQHNDNNDVSSTIISSLQIYIIKNQLTADPQLLNTAPDATPIYPKLSAHDGQRYTCIWSYA